MSVFVNVSPTPVIYDATTVGLVSNGFSSAQHYASQAFTAATQFLADLKTAALTLGNLPDVDGQLNALTLDISAFDYLIGTAPASPADTPSFTEIPYTSAYLTNLITQLDAWVTGASTGLAPNVEQAIWDRGRARESVNASQKVGEAIRTFATRGFTKPPGALSVEIQAALQTSQDANSSFSRDVAIKQADLEQSNRRFAFEQAWKVQEGLISYLNQQMSRAVESVKDLRAFVTSVYHEQVAAYATEAQVYATKTTAATTVFRAKIDAEVAEANIRIEAAKANVQKMLQQTTILVEELKAGAGVAAQLAASALSAVNLSAGMHASSSNSASNSYSASASASVSASDSTSNSTSYIHNFSD